MPVQLFSHNMRAYVAAKAMIERTSKAAVIHPTGTGKSFIAFKWIEEQADERFVWLSPSEYIYKTQLENVTRSSSGFPADRIVFMTYARLMMMTDEEIAALRPDGVILDEFHRCGAKCWGGGVARLLKAHPHARLLGLSATKIRYLDGQRDMAEELFEGCIASEMTLGEAVVRGILPTPTYITTVYQAEQELQRLQVRVDAVASKPLRAQSQRRLDSLRAAVESAEGLDAIFARYMKNKSGKYLVFCTSESHMKRVRGHVRAWFGGVDPDMHCYTAYSADPQTSRAFRAFADDDSDHLKLLLCINMLNEGVHVKDVSGVILFRPTVSPVVYKQQIGRALTTGMMSTPLIFDVVNNFDALSSYGTIQTEMDEAAKRLRRAHRGDEVLAERLMVIEQVKNSAELFRQLEESLCSTWDIFYEAAASYYKAHGSLEMPSRYVDENGYALARWISYQRHMRKQNKLSTGQIERLDALGMVWEEKSSLSWEEGYRHAQAFFDAHGHLNVEADCVCADGYALGAWIRRMRQQKTGGTPSSSLTEERIARLEAIGMIWKVYDEGWQSAYDEAKRFYEAHGHLNVTSDYVTESGFSLGHWLCAQRQARTGAYNRRSLTPQQIAALSAIGMQWETRHERLWRINYSAAKEYYEKHGNLNVPSRYETTTGIKLGTWVSNIRHGVQRGKTMDEKRYAQLCQIGMFAHPTNRERA